MDPKYELALSLLGIGMVTIFLILGLLVGAGRLLILLVNRFAVAPALAEPAPAIPPEHLAVIQAAVSTATMGRGRATSVQSVSP